MCEDNGIFVKSQELYYELKSKMNLKLKKIVSFILILVLILSASILVRLPHFLSQDFFFDGDEGVVGIMAQDFLECKKFPIYFYGQNYGLSTVEVFSVAIFIKILGSGIWALKLGSLLIFSVGLTFIYLTLKHLKITSFLQFSVLAILVCFPTWYLWATMPRGGYVTSFLVVSILFYITQLKEFNWKWAIISATLFAIGYEAQLLILISAIPFVILWISSSKIDYRKLIVFMFLGFAFIFLIKYLGGSNSVWNAPEVDLFNTQQLDNLLTQSEGFIFGYSNFFFFTMNIPIPLWWNVLLWISLILIFTYILIFYKETSRKKRVLLIVGILLLIFSIGLISAVSLYSPRYWLGFFTGLLLLFIYALINGKQTRLKSSIVLSVVLIFSVGLISGKDMKRDWYQVNVNEIEAISTLYKEVKSRKVVAVFIADPVMQWKWNYLFGKEIPGTFFSKSERTNAFKDRVFEEFNTNPEKVAIIGLHQFYNGLEKFESFNQNCYQISTKYYIMNKIEKQFVEILMKEFN